LGLPVGSFDPTSGRERVHIMRIDRSARAVLRVGVCRVVLAPLVVLSALPLAARGDVITSWNQYLLDNAIREDNKNPSPPGQPVNPYALGDKPPVVSRQLAMIHLAMFDAVNAVERRYQSYAPAPAAGTRSRRSGRPTTSRPRCSRTATR
jgi:hypothetical protein